MATWLKRAGEMPAPMEVLLRLWEEAGCPMLAQAMLPGAGGCGWVGSEQATKCHSKTVT